MLLIKHKADINATAADGKTPLQIVKQEGRSEHDSFPDPADKSSLKYVSTIYTLILHGNSSLSLQASAYLILFIRNA